MSSAPHHLAVARAVLPEVMFLADLALALQVDEDQAEAALLRGGCGPYIRIAGRLAVLRESFLDALARREEAPLGLPPHSSGKGEHKP